MDSAFGPAVEEWGRGPVLPNERFNPRAILIFNPAMNFASAFSFSASTIKWMWFDCTEKWISRPPNRSRPFAKASHTIL